MINFYFRVQFNDTFNACNYSKNHSIHQMFEMNHCLNITAFALNLSVILFLKERNTTDKTRMLKN